MYININTREYPLTLLQLRQQTGASFSRNPSATDLAVHGYAAVQRTERPTGDVVAEGQPGQKSDGTWAQTWEVRSYTEAERAERAERHKSELLRSLEDARKGAEAEGVTINGIRYSGDPSNRQALDESLQFATASGATTFPGWKDSDGVFHNNHPVADVQAAYEAIGHRRGALIALEGQYSGQVRNGELTSIDGLSWDVN